MEVICENKEFEKHLIRCIESYKNIYFAVAWASAGTSVFTRLLQNEHKIKKTTIGIHFYQTDPEVLRHFHGNVNVKFVKQPKGVFHPKTYLFSNDKGKDWEAIIGSANLTSGALHTNQEISILVSSDETNNNLKIEILSQLKSFHEDASAITVSDIRLYEQQYMRRLRVRRRLAGEYGDRKSSKSALDTRLIKQSWSKVKDSIQTNEGADLEQRLKLLETCRIAFKSHSSFSKMNLKTRQTIGGIPNTSCVYADWYGSMMGAIKFRNRINENDLSISNALSEIPITGEVTRFDYGKYIKTLLKTFPDGGCGIGCASRLLTMKRPDYFVCITNKNKVKLANEFGISQSALSIDQYWDEIISRITDSVWWNSKKPKNKLNRKLWLGRAALLDTLFYDE